MAVPYSRPFSRALAEPSDKARGPTADPAAAARQRAWGTAATGDSRNLRVYVTSLRQKIEPDPTNSRLLLTEGGGYRLDPEGLDRVVA